MLTNNWLKIFWLICCLAVNPSECRGSSYSVTSNNNEVGTLAVDRWVVTFGTARRGLGSATARPRPSSLY